ncbi:MULTISPECIES: hypothetical protein [Moorena]|nr:MULTISPECIES: hypothetical protein [Moorena]NEQ17329.1 hypothetical protein [Moorena sp. SIO3E2]NEP35006.1 hypothetical protein [Moorena sp. SIO3B2]NEP66771.1 hypothetical protein [Moorena sp. SIO3A5]NEQ08739.1 hypothetical protein [Moorena sp. SIO4E2]NER87164.1 hypothetical protein [Moorena sp. SIO3A2]
MVNCKDVSCQPSAVSRQLSAVSCQPSAENKLQKGEFNIAFIAVMR